MEHPLLGFLRVIDDGKADSKESAHPATRPDAARGSLGVAKLGTRKGFVAGLRALRLWVRRRREARELLAMSERELSDIGITRYDVVWAAHRSFRAANGTQPGPDHDGAVPTSDADSPASEGREHASIHRPSGAAELEELLLRGRKARSDAFHAAFHWTCRRLKAVMELAFKLLSSVAHALAPRMIVVWKQPRRRAAGSADGPVHPDTASRRRTGTLVNAPTVRSQAAHDGRTPLLIVTSVTLLHAT